MKDRYKKHWIDIYEHSFELVVTNDIPAARNNKRRLEVLDPHEFNDVQGLSSIKARSLWIFLRRDSITHDLIAHEVAHIVHFLFANVGQKIDPFNNEEFAYLSGHLAKLIYNDLKSWNIRVK